MDSTGVFYMHEGKFPFFPFTAVNVTNLLLSLVKRAQEASGLLMKPIKFKFLIMSGILDETTNNLTFTFGMLTLHN